MGIALDLLLDAASQVICSNALNRGSGFQLLPMGKDDLFFSDVEGSLLGSAMHLATKETSEDLILQQCHFPISARRDVTSHHYETISVSDHSRFRTSLGKSFGPLDEVVLAAWAILLRSYSRRNNVSFVVFLGSKGHKYLRNFTDDIPLQGNAEALVLQYDIFDGCLIQDVHASACRKCSRACLKKTQINTAFNLLSSAPLIDGYTNGGNVQLAHPQDDILSDGVSDAIELVDT